MRAGSFTRSVPMQEVVAGAMVQLRSKRKRRRWAGSRLPMVPAEEGHQATPDGGDAVQVAVEVADDGVDLEALVLVGQAAAAVRRNSSLTSKGR